MELFDAAKGIPAGHVKRYAYINTLSQAGSPTPVTFPPDDVVHARVWYNSNGNPTTRLYLSTGEELLLVDEYGAMNGIYGVSRRTVSRRKDL